jgi:hypothetical protein
MSEKKNNVVPFLTTKKSTKKDKENGIIEKGSFGELNYTVYSRGVIHLFDKENKNLFKKDCDLFENAIDKLNLNSLSEGDVRKIPGSGDNDTLVFTCVNGDIKLSLEKPEYNTVAKLKKILKLGYKKVDKKA